MTSWKPFNILEYRDKLESDQGSHSKHQGSYYCPNCHAKNFKVNLRTGQYDGYNCDCMKTPQGRQQIIEALSPSTWEKPVRCHQHRHWDYTDLAGKPLLRVHRQDDGSGKRKFWQKELREGKPRELIPLAVPYRYHDCLEAIKRGEKILWLEGESCVDASWQRGIPATTTIGGSNNYRSEQYKNLFPAGSVIICPDRDQEGLKYAEAIAADYPEAQWCYVYPETFLWQRLPKSGGADIADWFADGATAPDIWQAVGPQRQDVAAFEVTLTAPKQSGKASKPNRFKRQFEELKSLWGERLRFNELTKDIEFDGDPIDVGEAKVTLAVEEDLDISLNNVELMLKSLAKQQRYHPVREELNRCYEAHQDTTILTNLAQRYFGVSHPLYEIYLRRTLIAAVKRIFEPGCKVDTVLVLQGPQGYRKSSFFQTLAGEAYFDDSLGSMSDKDERLKLQLKWIFEWAELESIYRRRDIAAIKSFLTTRTDLVRAPYARKAECLPRQSIIVGSTNEDQFLNDSTGNRRFWVVPIKKRIDIQQLAQEREQIWGAAMALYLMGEQCWLTPEEEQQSQVMAADYQTSHPWEPQIEAYLQEWSPSVVTTSEILTKALSIEVGRQSKKDEMDAAGCLKRLGWRRAGRQQHLGKRRRVWVKSDQPDESAGQPDGQAFSPEVDQGQNDDSEGISAINGQPGQSKPATFDTEHKPEQQGQLSNWDKAYPPLVRPRAGVLTERRLE